MKKGTQTFINNSLFSILITLTDNGVREAGATPLSEVLKSNTTFTDLNLWSEDKRKTHKRHPSTIHSFFILIISTGNKIRDTGATSLSEVLKSNTTLTKLHLSCEDKRKKTHKRYPSTIHFFFILTSTGNEIGDTGVTSLSETLKSNAALTALILYSEDKRKTHKRHPSTNYFSRFYH